MTKSRVVKGIKIIVSIIIILLLLFAAFLLVATIKEWEPKASEKAISYEGADSLKEGVSLDTEYSAMCFNIGYGSLGEEAEFFMDGGDKALPEDISETKKNVKGIKDTIEKSDADFLMLQEVDVDSKRSYSIDERKAFDKLLNRDSSFAYNFRVMYLPYPLGDFMGEVNSGLYTSSKFDMDKGERIGLTVPFKWPERVFNLKRCLLVNRMPVKGSDKELVIVNLHLEAYDKHGGRKAQTKAMLDLVQSEYEKGNFVVAGGDWNQAFEINDDELRFPTDENLWKPETFQLSQALVDKGWKLSYGLNAPTSRLNNQPYTKIDENTYYYLIDGFLTSPNIKVNHVMTLDEKFKYSDHNPVKLEFELIK